MFRQVVAHRWAPGTTDDQRRRFRDALDDLRAIPEVSTLRYGDDAGIFGGNHEFVTVLDFPDLDAARRYVGAQPHQHFVADHARVAMAARVVVQHDWGVGMPCGLHHLKRPVTDVARSRHFYEDAFGFTTEHEFREDGVLRGVALHHRDADLRLGLREDPDRARALAGFDGVCLAVGTRADLDTVLLRLDAVGVEHTEPVAGYRGWAADVPDPDGLLVRLHTLL